MSSQLPTWLCRCLCPHGLVVTQLGTPWCPWDCTTGTLGYLSVACFFHCENQIIFSNSQASDVSRGTSIVAALGAAPGTCPQLGVQHLLGKARELPAPMGGPPEPLSTSLCCQPSGCFHSSKCGVGMKSPWGSRGLSLHFPLTMQGPEASQQERSGSSTGTRVCSAWAGVCPAGELQELNEKCWYE